MAIVSAAAPVGLRRGACAETNALRRATGKGGNLEIGGGAVSVEVADPLPIYSIPLATLAHAPDPLVEATQHGWRVLTVADGERHLVDMVGTKGNAKPNVIRGERSIAMFEKVGQFAADVVPAGVTYEARLLDIANIGVSALWLHAADADDRFFPIVSNPAESSLDALMNDARNRANRRLAAADFGSGPKIDGEIIETPMHSTFERGG
jgi:hypothetical protein